MIPELPTWETLRLVMPEIWLTVGMCAVILMPFLRKNSMSLPTLAALVGLGAALFTTMYTLPTSTGTFIFHDTLAIDPFSQFFKIILTLFSLLVLAQWLLTGRDKADPRDVPDFLCLLLGAAVGMSLMASANNLLMIFIAIEAASMPSYALAGFRKHHHIGSESSLKYVIFGSASSAIMIYGMSLVYGSAGSLDLPVIAQAAATNGMTPLMAVGLLAMFSGIAFKLSAVPLHFWCPDVFQGAPFEVTTFLSVASKGAAICLLLRVAMTFGMAGQFAGIATGIAIVGVITATWGNLAAYHQNNIKRLLAYSSIAHAGYMMMGVSVAAVVPSYVAGTDGGSVDNAVTALSGAILFYLLVYMFMNLGAFTLAATIANRTGSEDIRDYAGMALRSPMLGILLMVFLLSLFGMPGLGGFLGKIYIATAIGQISGLSELAMLMLWAGLLLNTLLSLFYYLRPVYYMFFVADTDERPTIHPRLGVTAMLVVCALALFVTGIVGQVSALTMEFGKLAGQTVEVAPVASPDNAAVIVPVSNSH